MCVIICLTSLFFILFVKDLLLMVNVVENILGERKKECVFVLSVCSPL